MAKLNPSQYGANLCAFLDMIAISELGLQILRSSDDGYNVLVGSTPEHVVTFDSYANHPHKLVQVPRKDGSVIPSTAAGRYQILAKFYDTYKVQLHLPDFSPLSQDLIAKQMIGECHALTVIAAGNISQAITLCHSRWASLTGAGYGQNEHPLDYLVAQYNAMRGNYA